MSNNEILKMENLKKIYSNTTEPVLKGIDLSIYEGDFLCVLGPSGCGKSTMIRCIAGFEDYEGTIEVIINKDSYNEEKISYQVENTKLNFDLALRKFLGT